MQTTINWIYGQPPKKDGLEIRAIIDIQRAHGIIRREVIGDTWIDKNECKIVCDDGENYYNYDIIKMWAYYEPLK